MFSMRLLKQHGGIEGVIGNTPAKLTCSCYSTRNANKVQAVLSSTSHHPALFTPNFRDLLSESCRLPEVDI